MTTPRHDPPAPETAALLAAAGAGDEQAWRDLIRLYWRRVYALVRSRSGRDDVAEEITQSVFVTMAERIGNDGYDERGRFESWLFRVAMNRLRDEIRRRRRAPGGSGSPEAAHLASIPAAAAETPTDEHEARCIALRTALATLNEADREIIELRHHAGLSFAQIADLLEEPLGTLLARHHRALKKVRDAMTEAPAPFHDQRDS